MTRQTLNFWMRKVNEQGAQAPQPVRRRGRPARLTAMVRQELEDHLERSPLEFGLNRGRWGRPIVVLHLKRRFGITLKVRQGQSWMHQLGYRLKRAGYSHLQAKGEGAQRFRQASKKLRFLRQGETIIFKDETGFILPPAGSGMGQGKKAAAASQHWQ